MEREELNELRKELNSEFISLKGLTKDFCDYICSYSSPNLDVMKGYNIGITKRLKKMSDLIEQINKEK